MKRAATTALLLLVLAVARARADDGHATPTPPPPGANPPPAPAPSVAAPAKVPKIGVDRTTHDFGVVKQEATLKTSFTIENDGDATLHLLSTRADCGCTVATLSTHELAPGQKAPIDVTLHTFSMSGTLRKRVFVASDDPKTKEIELHLAFDVAAGIVLDPARIYFGGVLLGTAPTASMTLKWKEGIGRPFHVKSVEAPGAPELAFDTAPFEAAPWHGTTISARFKKPASDVKTISSYALVSTDDPDTPKVNVPLTAFLSGRVWLDRRELSLGLIRQGDGRATMVGCRGLTKDVDLGEITVTAKGPRVAARAVATASKGEHLVEVKVADGAPVGRIDETVEVRCSIPSEPAATIHVTGEVLAGAGK